MFNRYKHNYNFCPLKTSFLFEKLAKRTQRLYPRQIHICCTHEMLTCKTPTKTKNASTTKSKTNQCKWLTNFHFNRKLLSPTAYLKPPSPTQNPKWLKWIKWSKWPNFKAKLSIRMFNSYNSNRISQSALIHRFNSNIIMCNLQVKWILKIWCKNRTVRAVYNSMELNLPCNNLRILKGLIHQTPTYCRQKINVSKTNLNK